MHEDLRDVVGVNVVDGFHAQVGEQDFLPLGQAAKDGRVEVAFRVERVPAGADDVTGVQRGGGEAKPSRLVHEILGDGELLDAVFAKGMARLVLGGGDLDAGAVGPDGPAMQEHLHLAAECLDQLLRARQREADHVDHDVGLEVANLRAERAVGFGGRAVDGDGADGVPRGMGRIGLALAAADVGDLVTGLDEPGDQIGPHMAAAADDDSVSHDDVLDGMDE